MAPRKRNQPLLASGNPKTTTYCEQEPDPEEVIEDDAVAVLKKQNRNLGQSELRAIPATSPKLD